MLIFGYIWLPRPIAELSLFVYITSLSDSLTDGQKRELYEEIASTEQQLNEWGKKFEKLAKFKELSEKLGNESDGIHKEYIANSFTKF